MSTLTTNLIIFYSSPASLVEVTAISAPDASRSLRTATLTTSSMAPIPTRPTSIISLRFFDVPFERWQILATQIFILDRVELMKC